MANGRMICLMVQVELKIVLLFMLKKEKAIQYYQNGCLILDNLNKIDFMGMEHYISKMDRSFLVNLRMDYLMVKEHFKSNK